jgi:purine-binding chemotaxis protein CheW
MAAKKKAKKAARGADKATSAPPKITLPAFGLAEEILGSRTEPREEQPGANGQSSPGTGDNFDTLSRKADDPAIRDNGPTLHLVTFSVDGEEYGIDISSVQEIIRVSQITAVPNAPDFVRGVINLRGRVIPVLNLRKRLELPDAVLTKNSRIMVVECGAKVLGLLVDSVSHVIRIPTASVDTPPGEVDGTKAFVKGIGKIDSRLIMIMELDKVLAKETRQPVG